MPGGGSKKGERRGGRQRGALNKATIERLRQGQIAQEKAELLAQANAAKSEVLEAVASGKKLMKEIAFDFAQLFAGLAAFHQPYPTWHEGIDPRTGERRMLNDNPNFDEARFKEYAKLACDTALGAASYESPKLSAVMVGAAVVNHIQVTGGIPDEQDGGLIAAEPGARTIELAGPDVFLGEREASDAASGSSEGAENTGEAEGAPGRTAVG
jgi:hypothetical protein